MNAKPYALSNKMPIVLPFTLGIALTWLLLSTLVARAAATWTVNTTNDTFDGACDANCSIRDALDAAASGDTIDFSVNGTITLTAGELAIIKDLAIQGPGAANLAISGNHLSRIFNVSVGNNLSIDGLTLRDGNAGISDGGAIYSWGVVTVTNSAILSNTANTGGGIYNNWTLTLIDTTIRDNYASAYGGGVVNFYGSGPIPLALTNTHVLSNSAGTGGGAGIVSWGGVSIANSTINYNQGLSGLGGGLFVSSAWAAIHDSTIADNIAVYGGGLYAASSPVTLTKSTLSGNQASNAGGGISFDENRLIIDSALISANSSPLGGGIYVQNASVVTLTHSAILTNTSSNDGGGIYFNGGAIRGALIHTDVSGNTGGNGGGITLVDGQLSLSNTSLISNTASSGGGGGIQNIRGVITATHATLDRNRATIGDGGGINNNNGLVTLIASTVSNNSAASSGGGMRNSSFGGESAFSTLHNTTLSANTAQISGGGILNNGSNSTVSMNNATIVGNTSVSGGGGGILNNAGTVQLKNTVLASNVATSSPDCNGVFTSQGYNLVSNTSFCLIAATNNLLDIPARLGSLQNNGGLTLTHHPLPGSPVIDAGNPASPGSGGDACLATDQRSTDRPVDGDGNHIARCNIGAVENYPFVFLPLILK